MILRVALDSFVLGLSYVLMASGLALVFGVMRIVNFAHGQFYMLGSFVIYYVAVSLGIPYLVALIIAMLLLGFMGIIVERAFIRPLVNAPIVAVLAIMLGLWQLFQGISEFFFGSAEKAVPSAFPGVSKIGGFAISHERLAMVFLSIAIIGILYFFINRTKQGTAIRAVAEDRVAAILQGIKIDRVSMLVMGIGCALAAAAGGIMAPIFYVDPFIGNLALIKGLIVITLGGMGSLIGALVGGLILGFVEGFAIIYAGAWAEMLGFVMIIIILLIRPQGLFGEAYELAE